MESNDQFTSIKVLCFPPFIESFLQIVIVLPYAFLKKYNENSADDGHGDRRRVGVVEKKLHISLQNIFIKS